MNQSFPAGVGKSIGTIKKPGVEVSGWKRVLQAWYNLTAPSDPGSKADFQSREAFRRGRLASIALLLVLFVVAVYTITNCLVAHPNWPLIAADSIGIAVLMMVAGLCNRQSHLLLTVCLLILVIDGGIATILLFVKGGIDLVNLPVFDLLIASELIAVSLLSPFSTFFIALFNSILSVLLLLFAHHSPNLDHYFAISGQGAMALALARPILLQFIVAVVTSLWVDSALKALKRADQAEALVALEHSIAEYERAQAADKRSLEHGIQYLIDTQRQVASGDMTARVPITQDNVLWPVAISFNNLLTRFQHVQEDADQLQQIYREMPRLVNAIREAKRTRRPIILPRGGTVLDALIVELTENRPEGPRR